jgi:ATP-dependent RNA helicase DDX21
LADQDFKDPAFLSTSNPRWVQAGLDQRVIDILSAKGITHFTPVQGEAFDPVLMGRDVIGRSRTGTGKTLAFGLPGITRLVTLLQEKGVRDAGGRMARGRKTSMLVLCPTRELARQVADEIASVARPLGLFAEVFHGGVSYDPQTRALRQGLDILVGTPGRVIDHLNRGNLDLSDCETVVLDEADEMLNMGFAEDVETILDGIGSGNKEKTQCLLFSATTPPWVKTIGKRYQTNVLAIDSTGNEGARVASTVRHLAVQVAPGVDSKRSVLEDIIAVEISKDLDIDSDSEDEGLEALNPIAYAAGKKKLKTNNAMQQKIFGKTIVFTETKRAADELVSGGVFKSLTAQALHGDVGQKQRDATLNAFRAGAFNVLVATDVAARGYVPRKDVARSGGQGSEANPAICFKLQN